MVTSWTANLLFNVKEKKIVMENMQIEKVKMYAKKYWYLLAAAAAYYFFVVKGKSKGWK